MANGQQAPEDNSKENDATAAEEWESGDMSFEMKNGLLFFRNRLYIPEIMRVSVLQMCHDNMSAGHFGRTRTLELVSQDYWWPKLPAFVENYIRSCGKCQNIKVDRQKPAGLLHPLPIPSERWAAVSLDFIGALPDVNGQNEVMVVVDKFTKMAHFVACKKEISSAETARLYIDHIYKHHGAPLTIVSDCGVQFVAKFWRHFWAALGAKPIYSTAFHPQTDGQTERVNSILVQYLRSFCNFQQTDWPTLLASAEFSYNNSKHSATGVTPFFANSGYTPRHGMTGPTGLNDNPSALAQEMQALHIQLNKRLQTARDIMKKYADMNRREAPHYAPGDKVYLASKNIKTSRNSGKLDHKWIGPLTVLEAFEKTDSVKLDIPVIYGKVHNVFHASLLKRHVPNSLKNREVPPPPPISVIGEEEEEFEIGDIVDSMWIKGTKNTQAGYRIRWKGYNQDADTWHNGLDIPNAQEFIDKFHKKYPEKPGPALPTTTEATSPEAASEPTPTKAKRRRTAKKRTSKRARV